MFDKLFFNNKTKVNTLEDIGTMPPAQSDLQPASAEDIFVTCPSCKNMVMREDMEDNMHVCPQCNHNFRLKARKRLELFTDKGSFMELYGNIEPENVLDFPDYDKKLDKARALSGENESVICGTSLIGGNKCAVFAMEGDFMMGSMGRVCGEKITLLFEYAAEYRLPVIGFCASGGARMQEGVISLMQMAKTSAAVRRHSDKRLLYISVLTDPTTGGVTASFAMQGDIIIAEPGALIAFAGPRVIEQTIRRTLPEGFQRAEFLLEKGFVDAIVSRKEMKKFLDRMIEWNR